MKYSLRYHSIVTTTRIKSAVIFSWVIAILSVLRSLGDFKILQLLVRPIYFTFRIFTLITIVYCHVSVYFITRRHEKQIQAAQVSPEAVANFLNEKKALRTTSIIIGVLIMCYIPLVLSARGGGGSTPRNSWWGCAARVFKPRPYFRPKHAIFHTRFQT